MYLIWSNRWISSNYRILIVVTHTRRQTVDVFAISFQSKNLAPELIHFFVFSFLVSSLMRGGASGMSAASQMSGLGCGSDKGSAAALAASAAASAMQFPLSQRRKRRVLFPQAQVRTIIFWNWIFIFCKVKAQTHKQTDRQRYKSADRVQAFEAQAKSLNGYKRRQGFFF